MKNQKIILLKRKEIDLQLQKALTRKFKTSRIKQVSSLLKLSRSL